MQFGLDALHREVRALDETHLDARATVGLALLRERDETLERRHRVRQVGLQDDARLEVVELRLRQQAREQLDRQVEVAVLLHVEVDELLLDVAAVDVRGAPTRLACVGVGVTGVRRWRRRVARRAVRDAVDRTQPLEGALDGALGVPRRDLRDEAADLDRDVVDVVAREQLARLLGATRGLGLTEDGLAEQIDVEAEAVGVRLGEVLRERRVARVDDEVADELTQTRARRGHDDGRHRRREAGTEAEQLRVELAHEPGRLVRRQARELARGGRVVLGARDAVDELHREVEALLVTQQRAELVARALLGLGLAGLGRVAPTVREGDGVLDEVVQFGERRSVVGRGGVDGGGARGVGCVSDLAHTTSQTPPDR